MKIGHMKATSLPDLSEPTRIQKQLQTIINKYKTLFHLATMPYINLHNLSTSSLFLVLVLFLSKAVLPVPGTDQERQQKIKPFRI